MTEEYRYNKQQMKDIIEEIIGTVAIIDDNGTVHIQIADGTHIDDLVTKGLEILKKKKDQPNKIIRRADGRLEWHCEHGVGHTIYAPKGSDFVHGCDGCCGSEEFKKAKKKIDKEVK